MTPRNIATPALIAMTRTVSLTVFFRDGQTTFLSSSLDSLRYEVILFATLLTLKMPRWGVL